jgi:hypothetical protein
MKGKTMAQRSELFGMSTNARAVGSARSHSWDAIKAQSQSRHPSAAVLRDGFRMVASAAEAN